MIWWADEDRLSNAAAAGLSAYCEPAETEGIGLLCVVVLISLRVLR